MNELGPDHVARRPVLVLASLADTGLHLRFHLTHGLVH